MGVIMSSASFKAHSKGYALPLSLHVERTCPEILLLFKTESVIGSVLIFLQYGQYGQISDRWLKRVLIYICMTLYKVFLTSKIMEMIDFSLYRAAKTCWSPLSLTVTLWIARPWFIGMLRVPWWKIKDGRQQTEPANWLANIRKYLKCISSSMSPSLAGTPLRHRHTNTQI